MRTALLLFSPILLLLACTDEIISAGYSQVENEYSLPHNGIPVIEIHTADGNGIINKKTWQDATLIIHGEGIFADMDETAVKIKGRGNSTFHFPKKPFNLSFETKHKMLGMKKSKKWVFIANYRDRTLLRNDLTYWIGRQANNLEWTPMGEFVDLIFNGNYVGNYYVCEKVNVNSSRVNIDEMTSSDISGETLTGGYLITIDKYFDEENKFRTALDNLPVGIVSPNAEVCQPEQIAYIETYLNTVESLLRSSQYEKVYQEYIDMPSFVDYYLIQTISGNVDFNAPLSVYLYKKRQGKLYAGPLWDFDYMTYNSIDGCLQESAWWYRYLLQDAHFRKEVWKRWNELIPQIKNEVFAYINNRRQYIFLSALANYQLFDFDYSVNMNNLNDTGFLLSIDRMTQILKERIEFLNTYLNR